MDPPCDLSALRGPFQRRAVAEMGISVLFRQHYTVTTERIERFEASN
jgi:hypothetical protein